MKKLLAILLLAFAGFASAQEATINTPITQPSQAKYVLAGVDLDFRSNTAVIRLDVKDSAGTLVRYFNATVPDSANPSATFVNFLGAIGTVRAAETGGAERKANFRTIGYLSDQGYFTATPITLVP